MLNYHPDGGAFVEDFLTELKDKNENLKLISEFIDGSHANNLNEWDREIKSVFEIDRFIIVIIFEGMDSMCLNNNSYQDINVFRKGDFSWWDLRFGLDSIEFMLRFFKNDIQKFNDFVKEKYIYEFDGLQIRFY